jgi:hypothetical protein
MGRDTLLAVDAAAPGRSPAAADRMAHIVWLQYSGDSRARLDRNGEVQQPAPPRGSLLVEAETGSLFTPAARRRTLIVPLVGGEISRDTQIALGEYDSRHGRAAALASFITWQAGRREELLSRLGVLTAGYGGTWHDVGYEHPITESLAHLAAGWRLMLDHLTERGACTAVEAGQLWQQAWDGLADAGRAHPSRS